MNLNFLLLLSVAAFAQTNPSGSGVRAIVQSKSKPDNFTITISNNTAVKLDTAKVTAAFKSTYTAFAVADGYDTKKEVNMRVIDTVKNLL